MGEKYDTYIRLEKVHQKFSAGFHVGYQESFYIFIPRAERTQCLCFIKKFGRGGEQGRERSKIWRKRVICRYRLIFPRWPASIQLTGFNTWSRYGEWTRFAKGIDCSVVKVQHLKSLRRVDSFR